MVDWLPLEFEVSGSDPEPYSLRFERAGVAFTSSCTCAAGMNRQLCKHRMMLLAGDTSALASANLADVEMLPKMLAGSETEAAMLLLAKAEEQMAAARAEVSRRRHAVARLFCIGPQD